MSVERMNELLDTTGNIVVDLSNHQGIFPEVGFSCSGSIQTWVFGAEWLGNEHQFTELQIWRPTGNRVYAKVGYTTIMTTRRDTELYEYHLSSPLPFQAGDVLGYYQPEPADSQLRIQFEKNGIQPQLEYFNDTLTSPANISGGRMELSDTILVNVVTGKSIL